MRRIKFRTGKIAGFKFYLMLYHFELKKNLHYFDKELLIEELVAMMEWLDEQEILSEIALDYRVKVWILYF